MKKTMLCLFLMLAFFIVTIDAAASGRMGSTREGGYTSSGKGSHYVGGR